VELSGGCDFKAPQLASPDGETVMFKAMQCRAARGLLRWTQTELSKRAGISGTAIRAFELEQTSPNPATLVVLQQTFERSGVEFIDGDQPGVRLRRTPQ
jgi:transcriptional regulator with XRE-family HTH domain